MIWALLNALLESPFSPRSTKYPMAIKNWGPPRELQSMGEFVAICNSNGSNFRFCRQCHSSLRKKGAKISISYGQSFRQSRRKRRECTRAGGEKCCWSRSACLHRLLPACAGSLRLEKAVPVVRGARRGDRHPRGRGHLRRGCGRLRGR